MEGSGDSGGGEDGGVGGAAPSAADLLAAMSFDAQALVLDDAKAWLKDWSDRFKSEERMLTMAMLERDAGRDAHHECEATRGDPEGGDEAMAALEGRMKGRLGDLQARHLQLHWCRREAAEAMGRELRGHGGRRAGRGDGAHVWRPLVRRAEAGRRYVHVIEQASACVCVLKCGRWCECRLRCRWAARGGRGVAVRPRAV